MHESGVQSWGQRSIRWHDSWAIMFLWITVWAVVICHPLFSLLHSSLSSAFPLSDGTEQSTHCCGFLGQHIVGRWWCCSAASVNLRCWMNTTRETCHQFNLACLQFSVCLPNLIFFLFIFYLKRLELHCIVLFKYSIGTHRCLLFNPCKTFFWERRLFW